MAWGSKCGSATLQKVDATFHFREDLKRYAIMHSWILDVTTIMKKNQIIDEGKITWAGDAKQCPDKKKEIDLYEKSESCDNEKCESE